MKSLAVLLFSKLTFFVVDTLIQIIFIQIIKIDDFWGDLTDISAGKEALVLIGYLCSSIPAEGTEPVLLFSKVHKTVFGYFESENSFKGNEKT